MRRIALGVLAGLLLFAAPAGAAELKRAGTRSWSLTAAAPASPDLSVVRLYFPPGRRAPRGGPALRAALRQGSDVGVVVGRLFPWRRGGLSALVAITHRHPQGALYPDVSDVRVTLSGARLTRRPRVEEVTGAFARRSTASPAAPALCRDRQGKVTDGMVRAVAKAGPQVPFAAAHVVAEAYDVACSRPVDPAFEQAFFPVSDPCPPPPPPPPCGPTESSQSYGPICPQPAYAPCPIPYY